MASKNIESLYSSLFSMRSDLEDMIQTAQGVINIANAFGGEINRVVGEQMKKYFIPTIQKMIDDTTVPGSLKGVITFLDSVPLAMTRIEPQADSVTPAVPDVDLSTPTGSNALPDSKLPLDGEPPYKASYSNPQGEQYNSERPQMAARRESLKRNKYTERYQVLRCSNKESSLGDVSKLKDEVVGEFDCKDDAECKAKELNKTVKQYEKEIFGTEYKVVEKEDYKVNRTKDIKKVK